MFHWLAKCEEVRNNSKELGNNSKELGNNSTELRNSSKELRNSSKELWNNSKELGNNSKELNYGNKELVLFNSYLNTQLLIIYKFQLMKYYAILTSKEGLQSAMYVYSQRTKSQN